MHPGSVSRGPRSCRGCRVRLHERRLRGQGPGCGKLRPGGSSRCLGTARALRAPRPRSVSRTGSPPLSDEAANAGRSRPPTGVPQSPPGPTHTGTRLPASPPTRALHSHVRTPTHLIITCLCGWEGLSTTIDIRMEEPGCTWRWGRGARIRRMGRRALGGCEGLRGGPSTQPLEFAAFPAFDGLTGGLLGPRSVRSQKSGRRWVRGLLGSTRREWALACADPPTCLPTARNCPASETKRRQPAPSVVLMQMDARTATTRTPVAPHPMPKCPTTTPPIQLYTGGPGGG